MINVYDSITAAACKALHNTQCIDFVGNALNSYRSRRTALLCLGCYNAVGSIIVVTYHVVFNSIADESDIQNFNVSSLSELIKGLLVLVGCQLTAETFGKVLEW